MANEFVWCQDFGLDHEEDNGTLKKRDKLVSGWSEWGSPESENAHVGSNSCFVFVLIQF